MAKSEIKGLNKLLKKFKKLDKETLNIQILDVCFAQFMNIQSDKLKHIVVLQGLDKVTARIETFHASTEEKTY